jgi:release factor glutamine methyltransferase
LQAEATTPKTWTVADIVRWATDDFRARGIESPRLDAELIVGFALHITRTQVLMQAMQELTPAELVKLRELVKRRRAREPMAYILGEREFYGRAFRVDARVLIPRPDTETLVEVALARTKQASMHARVLDLCTGSGCVAVTLARERPTTRVCGVDLSADAVAVARENAHRLGAVNVWFAVGDLFAGARAHGAKGPFEIVTANPPYIPTAEIPTLQPDVAVFEPKMALDGGADGLDIARRIIDEAPAHLTQSGVLALEVAAGQAPTVLEYMQKRGFSKLDVARDYGRIERVVSGIFSRSQGR